MTKQKTAALYARYSSDIQNDASIDRQFADLEKAAMKLGLKLDKKHYYSDRAQSGSSLFERPGLTRELCSAARAKKFDIVLVEKTDRLSRKKADLFWLSDVFKFANVEIWTPSSGFVTDLQLLFEAHQNEEFIATLRMRVKSGHDQSARQGRIVTSPCYGYDTVLGKPGVRVINKTEAAIIVRIFTEYASGMTPRQIVAGMHRDNIPSPTGASAWSYQGIVGGAHKRGLIRNRLYIGEYVKNRYFNVKNPETGKRTTRVADADDLIVIQHPDLRIIPQTLWDAAHAVREGRAEQKFGAGGYQRATLARKQSLLSGLLRCAQCQGTMTVTASSRIGQRVGCSTATYRKTCSHTKTYDLGKISSEVIDKMCAELTNPEMIKERMKAKTIEFARLERESSGERVVAQKSLDRLNMQIAKLVRLLDESDSLPGEVIASLKVKETERVGLKERIRLLGAETNITVLHPSSVTAFGRVIETLAAKLKSNPDDPECRMAFANVIDGVIIHPTANGQPYEMSLYARISAIHGIDLFPAQRSHQEIVAAEAFPRVSVQADVLKRSRLNRNNTTSHRHGGDIILLGRWRAAA